MYSVVRGNLALVVLGLGFAACGGGGGGSSTAGGVVSAPPIPSSTTTTTTTATTPVTVTATPAPMSVTLSVVDYFTNQTLAGATIALDDTALTLSGTAATLMPTPGLHTLTITAAGYATYNGALQSPGGSTTRVIALFPISQLMGSWLTRVNADRAANGRSVVALDDMLTISAYDHAVDMGTRGYFAHFDTHGYAPTTRALMLGSMMMGAENIAAGYSSWSAAEDAFMGEQASLPNQSPSDCATHANLAGHYCNIVSLNHNWVGLAAVDVGGSKYGTYYGQEYGDLYGTYDVSVVAALTSSEAIALSMAPANGSAFQSQAISVMPAPQPISTTVLNSDPECASQCPAADFVYPQNPSYVSGAEGVKLTPASDQLTFVSQYGSITTFVGAGSWALAAPGVNVPADSYTSSSDEIRSQSIVTGAKESGVIAGNGIGRR